MTVVARPPRMPLAWWLVAVGTAALAVAVAVVIARDVAPRVHATATTATYPEQTAEPTTGRPSYRGTLVMPTSGAVEITTNATSSPVPSTTARTHSAPRPPPQAATEALTATAAPSEPTDPPTTTPRAPATAQAAPTTTQAATTTATTATSATTTTTTPTTTNQPAPTTENPTPTSTTTPSETTEPAQETTPMTTASPTNGDTQPA
jgi:hypothetical protein